MEKEMGTVFNLQKFSLHDGPGIRTVVFLKGCPLRCEWCANPESQNPEIELLWDAERWPEKVKRQEGWAITVEKAVELCVQDRDFYEESGGGVTLSGGEPLMQSEFSASLLRALKAEGIHTAVETTGYASSQVFSRVAGLADLLLFDVKHWEDKAHRKGTGASNGPILENLKWAVGAGIRVLPRMPVIPGYNNSLEDVEGLSECLKELGIQELQLLPFHQMGERKYEMLERPYAYGNVNALSREEVQGLADVFAKMGIHAFLERGSE